MPSDFSEPKEKPLSKIDISKSSRLTFESVTRHAFQKREIDVNKRFEEVPKLNLG